MAITKSAKKALRQSKRRKVFNDKRSRAMRETLKRSRAIVRTKAAAKDALQALSLAYQAIDKAAKRGLIKKNTAARKKSQIARALAAKN